MQTLLRQVSYLASAKAKHADSSQSDPFSYPDFAVAGRFDLIWCISLHPKHPRQLQWPEQLSFLALVARYSAKNVIKHSNGSHDVWALVEHDVFRSLPQGGVGDFGARRYAFFRQILKNLRGPNDRNVNTGRIDCSNDAPDFAIADPNPFPRLDVAENRWQRATNLSRRQPLPAQIQFVRPAGYRRMHHDQRVTLTKCNRLFNCI